MKLIQLVGLSVGIVLNKLLFDNKIVRLNSKVIAIFF